MQYAYEYELLHCRFVFYIIQQIVGMPSTSAAAIQPPNEQSIDQSPLANTNNNDSHPIINEDDDHSFEEGAGVIDENVEMNVGAFIHRQHANQRGSEYVEYDEIHDQPAGGGNRREYVDSDEDDSSSTSSLRDDETADPTFNTRRH